MKPRGRIKDKLRDNQSQMSVNSLLTWDRALEWEEIPSWSVQESLSNEINKNP